MKATILARNRKTQEAQTAAMAAAIPAAEDIRAAVTQAGEAATPEEEIRAVVIRAVAAILGAAILVAAIQEAVTPVGTQMMAIGAPGPTKRYRN